LNRPPEGIEARHERLRSEFDAFRDRIDAEKARPLAVNKKEAARLLGVSPPTLDKYIRNGLLAVVEAADVKRVTHAEIERFLEAQTKRAPHLSVATGVEQDEAAA